MLYSVQHLWIFSEESLKQLARQAGFKEIKVSYYQRYGMENLLGWCLEKRPNSSVHEPFFAGEVDAVWKSSCARYGMADYIVLYAKK